MISTDIYIIYFLLWSIQDIVVLGSCDQIIKYLNLKDTHKYSGTNVLIDELLKCWKQTAIYK